MGEIDNLVAQATNRRDRLFATAAIMTISQTYRAAVVDLGIEPAPGAMDQAITSLQNLAQEPVHGKQQWMLDHAWNTAIQLLEPYLFESKYEEETGIPVARKASGDTNSFPLVLARFGADFADNLRIAEQCDR